MAKNVPLNQKGSLSIRESLEYTGMGYKKVRRLIDEGSFRAYPQGQTIKIIRRSIDEWMEAQAQAYQRAS